MADTFDEEKLAEMAEEMSEERFAVHIGAFFLNPQWNSAKHDSFVQCIRDWSWENLGVHPNEVSVSVVTGQPAFEAEEAARLERLRERAGE